MGENCHATLFVDMRWNAPIHGMINAGTEPATGARLGCVARMLAWAWAMAHKFSFK